VEGPALVAGGVVIPGRVALAPLAGYTEYPLRAAVARFGCGFAMTPLISAEAVCRGTAATAPLLATGPDDARVVCAQVFGGKAARMAAAARRLADSGFPLVGVNVGCPVAKVRRQAAGAALLDDLPALAAITRAVVAAAAPTPVVGKIRTGTARDAAAGAKAAEVMVGEGVAALAVHGRNVTQGFVGRVDSGAIARVVRVAADIPVWANGGVRSPGDAADLLARTGAAAVMVGRGALGRPWFIAACERFLATGEEPPSPGPAEMAAAIREHFARETALYGEARAAPRFRKHLLFYLRALNAAKSARVRAAALTDGAGLNDILESLLGANDGP
jgi:tRNA-dihydrouridine synthase B